MIPKFLILSMVLLHIIIVLPPLLLFPSPPIMQMLTLASMLCMIVGHVLLFFYLSCVTLHAWICSKTYPRQEDHHHAQCRVQGYCKRVSPRPSPPPTLSASTTTSLWMYPHYVNEEWKRLPLVPYESYTEYRTLRSAISQEYALMVQKVLYGILYGADSDSSGISMHKEMMKPWHLTYNGFRDYITDAWINEGKDVFLVFTKGVDKAWCHAMSVYFALRLNTAVKVFVSHHHSFQLQSLSDLSFEFFHQEIKDFMCREIEGYVLEGDFNPYDRIYTFERVNFTHLSESNPRPLSIITEESGSIFKILEDHFRIIPTGKFQDMMFAFAMGTRNEDHENDNSSWHTRPSSITLAKKNQTHCLLSMLTDDILRIIFRYDIFHHGETQSAFT
jgi:hypothetical protein